MTDLALTTLTPGAAFFLEHAMNLLCEQSRRGHPGDPFREPFERGVARVGAVLKRVAGSSMDLSPQEREALSDLLRVASGLAQAARSDPRWERLGHSGDAARELAQLRRDVLRPTLLDDLFFSTAA